MRPSSSLNEAASAVNSRGRIANLKARCFQVAPADQARLRGHGIERPQTARCEPISARARQNQNQRQRQELRAADRGQVGFHAVHRLGGDRGVRTPGRPKVVDGHAQVSKRERRLRRSACTGGSGHRVKGRTRR